MSSRLTTAVNKIPDDLAQAVAEALTDENGHQWRWQWGKWHQAQGDNQWVPKSNAEVCEAIRRDLLDYGQVNVRYFSDFVRVVVYLNVPIGLSCVSEEGPDEIQAHCAALLAVDAKVKETA